MELIVVYGPPCAGKSTYVKKHITTNDIVYDYDMLTRALTYGTKHVSKRDLTHKYVIDFRLAIIKRIREDAEISKVYIISTFLTDNFKRFIEDLNPTYIKMECTEEECISRLYDDEERPDKEQWELKIKEWFALHGNTSVVEPRKNKTYKMSNKRQTFNGRQVVTPYRKI